MPLGQMARLLQLRVLQNFVRAHSGRWADREWRSLVERVHLMGYEIPDDRLRRVVDENLERWLAGENDPGPPPEGASGRAGTM